MFNIRNPRTIRSPGIDVATPVSEIKVILDGRNADPHCFLKTNYSTFDRLMLIIEKAFLQWNASYYHSIYLFNFMLA